MVYLILIIRSKRSILVEKLMRNCKLFVLLAFVFCLTAPVYAYDSLNLPTETIKGKFESVSDGIIVINQKGVRKSFVRTENLYDVYTDYISYRISPFARKTDSMPCKIVFIDTFNIKFKTPNSNLMELPRYRVSDIEINIK